MDHNEAETKRWIYFCATAVLIVASIAGCSAVDTHTKADALVRMVQAGADPMRARCASGDASREICMALAVK